jgi:hypothetical protein
MSFPGDVCDPFLEVASWVRSAIIPFPQAEIDLPQTSPFPAAPLKSRRKTQTPRRCNLLSKRNLGWHCHNYPIPLPLPASAPDFATYLTLFNLVIAEQRDAHTETNFRILGALLRILSAQDLTVAQRNSSLVCIELRDLLQWLRPGVRREHVVRDISEFYRLMEGDMFL